MVAPAYLLLGGGAALALYAARDRIRLALPGAEDPGRAERATVDPSVARFAPVRRTILAPSVDSSVGRFAPDPQRLRPAPFTGVPALAYADALLSGRGGRLTPLPDTMTGHLVRQLLKGARARAQRKSDWASLAEAVRVAAMAGAAQGFDAADLTEANRWVDFAKHVLFSPEWTAGMSEREIRAQAGRAMLAIWGGGIAPATPPDVLVPADAACGVKIPVMGETYADLFAKRGKDWGGGCGERMRRLRKAWEDMWRQGGPDAAPMEVLRYTFADMARQRAGAAWMNTSSNAAALPGTLRQFIVGLASIAGPVWGGFVAEGLLREAES